MSIITLFDYAAIVMKKIALIVGVVLFIQYFPVLWNEVTYGDDLREWWPELEPDPNR